MAKITLSPPWVEYYEKVNTFFKGDEEVNVVYDDDAKTIKYYVSNLTKATALDKYIPCEVEFGNVKVQNIVIMPNAEKLLKTKESTYSFTDIFLGRKDIEGIYKPASPYAIQATYIVFEKQVIQYFTDSLNDINGLTSTLNETLAYQIFGDTMPTGYFFCTSNLNKAEI